MLAAVRDDSGHYHLNGHLVVENGRTEIIRQMAGSKFKYKMLDDSRDYLYSLGPLHDSLVVEVFILMLLISSLISSLLQCTHYILRIQVNP